MATGGEAKGKARLSEKLSHLMTFLKDSAGTPKIASTFLNYYFSRLEPSAPLHTQKLGGWPGREKNCFTGDSRAHNIRMVNVCLC